MGFFHEAFHVMALLLSYDEEGKQEELAGPTPYWTWSPGILSVCVCVCVCVRVCARAESRSSCPGLASHCLETVLV